MSSATPLVDGYIIVVKHGESVPIAADYFFEYQ